MKIAIDISQIVYEGTGVGQYTRSLVENVLRFDKKNDYILFGTSLRKKNILDQFANDLRSKNLKFKESFWLLPPTFTSEIWNTIHYVKIEKLIGKFDVLHSSDWVQPPSDAKKITTIHDLVIYKFPENSHPHIVATQVSRLKWVQKECDKIIAVSKSTKNDIEEILKIPSEKISVIYEGVGEQFKGVVPEKKQSKKYILAMGGIGNRKNTDRVEQAFMQLERNDLDLAIIGKNLGFVPENELPNLYANAEMFVYPSLYEGFGLPVLEAMSVGCPVVTSNQGSLPEVGGKAALYVDPKSVSEISAKMSEILSWSPKTRSESIKAGESQSLKFSWEKTARETIKVYEQTYGKK